MKTALLPLVFAILCMANTWAQADQVSVVKDDEGMRLVVNGQDFMINGMNWDYVPIGTTITDPGIWRESDDVIRAALDAEMSLLRNMGVNAIRTYNLPPKWIKYIHDKHGIYTMLNITFGAYGLTINGGWVPNTDYSDPATREVLMAEARNMVETYKDTPGLLLYMIGNENNYHLSWTGAETEDIPINDKSDGIKLAAKALYKAFNDAAKLVKAEDSNHPVAICNGDLLYLDIVKEECTDIDIYGTNMYRGESFGDAFQRVKDELNMPILFSEFGADAFNAAENQEDQYSQAYYDVLNWKDIYENAAGLGRAGNSIGGFTFQFSDGWWKFGQTKNLDVHDNNASWSNGGYSRDMATEGQNNMNEEWFGICAKGPTNERGLYSLYPRAAYYALKDVHQLNPYSEGMTLEGMQAYFSEISLMEAVLQARGDKASLDAQQTSKIKMSRLSAEFSTFNTGGSLIETPDVADPRDGPKYPNELGFDHMQSFFFGVEANPTPNMRANVEFNVLGNVAENPINEIFYENRGRRTQVQANPGTPQSGPVEFRDINRIQMYRADFDWKHEYFDLNGFYRTGHYHWGYEGDFFGLYPEANYGPNIDIYNGEAPLGFEADFKKELKGLTVAMGPELWWGANPAVLAKYTRKVGNLELTGVFHEDLEQRGGLESSFAVPVPKTRRATLQAETEVGRLGIQVGGIWGGQPLNGRTFQIARERDNGEYDVYQDEISGRDNWGGKLKLTYSQGPINWYAQGAVMGLVANGGGDYTRTFTGWRLKDSGSGNQYNFLTGFTYALGNIQIAPNFLWQKPIEGPIPSGVDAPGRPRNILDDPFVVRANRETVAGEILFTYDPTPATWMYAWDNDRAEDAKFAANLGFVYRHLPTTQDAAIGILPDGRTAFAFPGAAPAQDLWEIHSRMVSKLTPEFGIIGNIYGGTAQANGDSERLIKRFGLDVRAIYKQYKMTAGFKLNDWGPFDYHRDFNQTYPQQIVLDLSTALGKPKWFALPNTTLGVMTTWRSLNRYSPRYAPTYAIDPETNELAPDPDAPGFGNGSEWEIRTYIRINVFQ